MGNTMNCSKQSLIPLNFEVKILKLIWRMFNSSVVFKVDFQELMNPEY